MIFALCAMILAERQYKKSSGGDDNDVRQTKYKSLAILFMSVSTLMLGIATVGDMWRGKAKESISVSIWELDYQPQHWVRWIGRV